MNQEINNYIAKVFGEVVDDISIETHNSKQKQIKTQLVLLIRLIIVFWSFIRCCNNKNVDVPSIKEKIDKYLCVIIYIYIWIIFHKILTTITDYIPKNNQFESVSGIHTKAIIIFYSDYGCEYYEPFYTYALKINKYGFNID